MLIRPRSFPAVAGPASLKQGAVNQSVMYRSVCQEGLAFSLAPINSQQLIYAVSLSRSLSEKAFSSLFAAAQMRGSVLAAVALTKTFLILPIKIVFRTLQLS